MKLFIDGDSTPAHIIDICLKAHSGGRVHVVYVGDRLSGKIIDSDAEKIIIPSGSGRTDSIILDKSGPGDIAVTADLYLARELIEKNVTAVNYYGKIWEKKSLERRIKDSEIMRAMRNGGIVRFKGKKFSAADKEKFANTLDHILSRRGVDYADNRNT